MGGSLAGRFVGPLGLLTWAYVGQKRISTILRHMAPAVYADLQGASATGWRFWLRRAWSEKVVGPWKRRRPLLVAACAVIVIGCGIVGFSHVPVGASKQPSVLDDLYRSLQLFALGGGNAPSPDVFLQVARFLGPVVVGYAAVGAVLGLYRDQLNLFWASRMRRHVVVAGLGHSGLRLASAFAAEGWRVLAIERDGANLAVQAARGRGLRVLVGDAADPGVLRHAASEHAVLLVAMCGDDRTNLDVAAAGRKVAERRHGPSVLTAILHFDNFDLWYVMKAQALLDREESCFRLELVNVPALAARLLLVAHAPFGEASPGSPLVAVVSEGGRADSLVEGILRRWQACDRSPTDMLTLVLVGPEGSFSQLFARHRGIGEVPGAKVTRAVTQDASTDSLVGLTPAQSSVVYIDLEDESAALAVAIGARERAGYDGSHRVVLSVEDDRAGVGQAVGHGGPAMRGIEVFGRSSQALRPRPLLESTASELIARLGHEHHLEHQRSLGVAEGSDPSLVPWEELPPALRHSNRMWADGIPAKLLMLNCAVVPAPLGALPEPFSFTPAEVERLAPLEHERWNADMKKMGYRAGPRDASHHPFIDVPFDDLPEANKEKDREHVSAIPTVLAKAGFQLQRVRTATANLEGVGERSGAGGGNDGAVERRARR